MFQPHRPLRWTPLRLQGLRSSGAPYEHDDTRRRWVPVGGVRGSLTMQGHEGMPRDAH